MDYYAGIDVSLECSSVCVVDSNGKIIREGKAASEPEALIGWLRSLGYELSRIGLEAGPVVAVALCGNAGSGVGGRTAGDTARAEGVRGDAGEVGPQ
jgi:transposase